MMQRDLELPVDLTNPGQFFACCGLLEAASRMDPEAVGWFDDGRFRLCAPTSGAVIATRILAALGANGELSFEPVEGRDASDAIVPLMVRGPFELRLDWWLDTDGETSELKTWAGQMRVARILAYLRNAWSEIQKVEHEALPFDRTVPLTGRFGFDPRAGWNALDVGFSPNAQGLGVETSPLVELLAAFGLQRFRPGETDGRGRTYAAWQEPSRPPIAALRAAGCIPTKGSTYEFRIESRGKYKSFSEGKQRRDP